MIDISPLRAIFIGAAASVAACLIDPAAPLAATAFSGVAAGDMSANDAILWTRTVESATSQPVASALTAQLADKPEFRNVLFTYKGMTDSARAGELAAPAIVDFCGT